ncbi:MAG: hypothetical protein AB7D03_09990 [Thiomicrospira sp.]
MSFLRYFCAYPLQRLPSLGGLLLISALGLSGCASYGLQTDAFFQQLEAKQWQAADQQLQHALNAPEDRLLYLLERGMLKHLQGDYAASNTILEQAKQHHEQLYTRSLSEEAKVLLSNPRQRTYRAQDFERLYIEYIQALNYEAIANQSPNAQALDDARVMVRQIEIQLNDLQSRQGDYQTKQDAQESSLAQLLALFRLLNGDAFNPQDFVQRDNAWLRYLTGIVYEQLGELNEARVAYQQAATLYQQGYIEQYGLDIEMQHQAWFDALRIMKLQGIWQAEWPHLAAQHLPEQWQQRLTQTQANQAQIILIQHQGWLPKRKEMNAILLVNKRTRNMEVYPFPLGSFQDAQAQQLWFYLMYSDKGWLRLGLNIYQDQLRGLVRTPFSKTLYLDPIWHEVQQLGLDKAAETPLRVTIPYYNLFDLRRPQPASVSLNGQPIQQAWLADSPAMQAVQSQLVGASEDFYSALLRAFVKRMALQSVTRNQGALQVIGDIAISASERAETRNWLTLPATISLNRITVEPGTIQLTIAGQSENLNIQPGQILILQRQTPLQPLKSLNAGVTP